MNQRVYFDHDSADSELVRGLRRRGHDCLTSAEAGMEQATDLAQLEFARSEMRVFLTANQADFAQLHAEWLRNGQQHSGMIIASQRLPVGSKLRRLTMLFNDLDHRQLANRIEYLTNWPEE